MPCRAGILTSDYRHSARPRAGSRPSLADSGELSSRSRGRRFRPGRQRLVLGNNSRRGAAPTSGYHFVPPESSRPYVERTSCGCSLPPPVGQPADRPAGGQPTSPQQSATVWTGRFPTMLTGVHWRPPPSAVCANTLRLTAGERCRTGVNEWTKLRPRSWSYRRPVRVSGRLEPFAYILHSSAGTWLDLPTWVVDRDYRDRATPAFQPWSRRREPAVVWGCASPFMRACQGACQDMARPCAATTSKATSARRPTLDRRAETRIARRRSPAPAVLLTSRQ